MEPTAVVIDGRTARREANRARTKVEADDVEVVIDVLLSAGAWDQLSTDHSRSRAQIRRAWTCALLAVLA